MLSFMKNVFDRFTTLCCCCNRLIRIENFFQVELEEFVKINDLVYKVNRNNESGLVQLVEHRRVDFGVCNHQIS